MEEKGRLILTFSSNFDLCIFKGIAYFVTGCTTLFNVIKASNVFCKEINSNEDQVIFYQQNYYKCQSIQN